MKGKVILKAGIVGAAGYTGGEVIRLLLNHRQVKISYAISRSHTGQPLWIVHPDLLGETDLSFSSEPEPETDVLFLCLGHGEASQFLERNDISAKTLLIDLSQDHRISSIQGERTFIYGLPEMNREQIASAKSIANPGCFATAIELALLPLAKNNLLKGEIHISATTGSTGAGHSPSETTHFSRRNSNLSVYKAFEHQHLAEIMHLLRAVQPGLDSDLNFIPYRGAFSRGILASIYLDLEESLEAASALYKQQFKNEPFVFISTESIDLKQVVNTNKCLLHLKKHGKKFMIECAIDNLLKGASGQAVQNMNIAFGINETEGLKLKAVAF